MSEVQQLFSGNAPKLVLFDLDGTLVDSVPDLTDAVDKMLIAMDRPPAGIGSVRTWVGNGAPMLVKRALAGDMSGSDICSAEYEKAYALFLQFYGEASAHHSELYPGALECLEGLKRKSIKMGLVTNKPIRFTRQMLEGFKLDHFFAVVIGGDSLPQKKPEAEPLLYAMQQCDSLPAETLMVGDSKSDVGAARAAGCSVLCVPYGYNHGEDIAESQPDLMIDNLKQLSNAFG